MLRLQTTEQSFGPYVLMTAAHNEENFIEGVLTSVVAQTLLPKRWVIVSDNSSDRTDEIVAEYARRHAFIHLLRVERSPGRNFGSKVLALRHAEKLLEGMDFEFIGNLDADVFLERSYFEELIRRFREHLRLGIAGGYLYESLRGEYQALRLNDARNVGHAAQLVRRECYEAIGGYAILKYGGEDWYAQTLARMRGWSVEAFPALKIFHRRHTTGGSSPLRNAFRQGKQDYSFGSTAFFELMKCLRRLPERPYVLYALARLSGFVWPAVCKEPKAVPEDVAHFLRREQTDRVLQTFLCPWAETRLPNENIAQQTHS